MPLERLRILGNPNIGVYICASNKYALIPKGVTPQVKQKVSEVLNVETVEAQVAGTPLLGVFLVCSDDVILAPNIMRDNEINELREIGFRVTIIETKHTALGNVVLRNSKAALLSVELSEDEVKSIINSLGIEKFKVGKIANMTAVGSAAVITDKGAVVHPDVSDEELRFISEFFNVNADIATVNFGVAFIKTGLVANNYGALVGERTTGPEIMRIMKALGIG